MRQRLALAAPLVVAALGAMLTSSGSTALTPLRSLPVSASDQPDDVRVTRDKGLADADRRSIEVTGLDITDHGTDVRFTLRVSRVDRSPRFTQIFFIDIDAKGFAYGQVMVATHSLSERPARDDLEHSIDIEGTDAAEGYVECDDLAISIPDGADRWWVDVPRRCLPAGPARIHVYAQTGEGPDPDGDAQAQFSDDSLIVPGRVALPGTLRPE